MTSPTATGEQRVVFALVLQPLLAAVLAGALFPLVELTGRPLYGGRPAQAMDAAMAFALGVAVVAALVTFLAATPLLLWLRRRGPVTRRHALVSGLCLGNVPLAIVLVFRAISDADSGGAGAVLDAAVYGTLGALRAIVFGSVMGIALALVFYWMCGGYLAAAGPSTRTGSRS